MPLYWTEEEEGEDVLDVEENECHYTGLDYSVDLGKTLSWLYLYGQLNLNIHH